MVTDEYRRLVARIQLGDHTAMGELYDALGCLIYQTVGRLIGFSPAAEDITTTVFVEAWRSPTALARHHDQLPNYLTRRAHHHTMIRCGIRPAESGDVSPDADITQVTLRSGPRRGEPARSALRGGQPVYGRNLPSPVVVPG